MGEPVEVRSLTPKGVSLFRDYLAALRKGMREPPPRSLLWEEATSEPVEPEGEAFVEEEAFGNRMAAARYLRESLSPLPSSALEANDALWSWLSLFYFDQVCPASSGERRKPGREYRHIPAQDAGDRRRGLHRHRHLLKGPWQVYHHLGEGARLLLHGPVHRENAFFHELASRQGFISNPGIIEAADRLYFDPERGGPKRRAVGRSARTAAAGSLERFVTVVRQLELNYDLFSIPAEDLLALLPAEFDRWKGG